MLDSFNIYSYTYKKDFQIVCYTLALGNNHEQNVDFLLVLPVKHEIFFSTN